MNNANKNTTLITNELLLSILDQLYSIELLLADVYSGKANLRYSNAILDNDALKIESLRKIVEENIKEVEDENE